VKFFCLDLWLVVQECCKWQTEKNYNVNCYRFCIFSCCGESL